MDETGGCGGLYDASAIVVCDAVVEECIRGCSSAGTPTHINTFFSVSSQEPNNHALSLFCVIPKSLFSTLAMYLLSLVGAAALLRAALAHPSTSLEKRNPQAQLLSSRDVCSGNTASTRSEWCDYSIDTDYTTGKLYGSRPEPFEYSHLVAEVPNTGATREYWLTLDDATVAPDGVSRSAMAVNG